MTEPFHRRVSHRSFLLFSLFSICRENVSPDAPEPRSAWKVSIKDGSRVPPATPKGGDIGVIGRVDHLARRVPGPAAACWQGSIEVLWDRCRYTQAICFRSFPSNRLEEPEEYLYFSKGYHLATRQPDIRGR